MATLLLEEEVVVEEEEALVVEGTAARRVAPLAIPLVVQAVVAD